MPFQPVFWSLFMFLLSNSDSYAIMILQGIPLVCMADDSGGGNWGYFFK